MPSALPLVTVVIPAFNAEPFIREAIVSIQRQTIDDWQLIVVDDGSTDQTMAVATQAAGNDARIRLIHLDQNQGITVASNVAFDEAEGEFIARLDADDRALAPRLATQVAAFKDSDLLAAVGSHARVFGDVPEGVAYCALGDANIKARLLDGLNTISGGTLMVRRSFIREHHIRFDERMASAEDLDYLASIMAAGGQLANVDQVLTEHRSHATSFTASRHDIGRQYLQTFRRRLLAIWYPRLDPHDLDLIVEMFFEPYPPHTEALLETVRAIDRLIVANADDYGQDSSVVHTIVLKRLLKMAALYRDHALLNASHLQAIRCFASSTTTAALDQLGL
ncbi:glycosyl transferase [Burkholderia sp. SRS-W-2-2016]|uniref:glycosyltransferase family 2 protein n=1 Tax=Burkholderia sp. SRS-W-2-2016 TaxID=1926878 RepID=UPI00094B1851|nr:glycosyltransferase family A protein [Burkholderia sp. SRS-W-2-2016]OLL32239.1 glycosyl transferase [Burkholderia sp. SRS-W-2-2016]